MIKYIEHGDLFESKVDALVNPVNCKGTMGKGIAKEFKRRFPECIYPYKKACADGKLQPGKLQFIQLTVQLDFFDWKQPKLVLFPTKNHWRGKSRIEWIEEGLAYLKNHYAQWGLKSFAMPQLGCGLGGLQWEKVKPLIERYFAEEPIEVEVYLRAIHDYNEMPPDTDNLNTKDK